MTGRAGGGSREKDKEEWDKKEEKKKEEHVSFKFATIINNLMFSFLL